MRRSVGKISSSVFTECRRASCEGMSGDRRQGEVNRGVDGVARPSDTDSGSKCFVSRPNPVTGQTEWVMQAAHYDYHQEIARSAYADMLHDTERNQKYYLAISKAVQLLQKKGQGVRVLDIGTGTGLLSMMAATVGADSVTACEAFEPMASCAAQVMAANGLKDKIQLIHARSTGITVGTDGAMSQRANLLVTEVFDTELIGEGAISTYTHAHEHLLQKDCVVVPRAANMYVQPVSSKFIRRWNDLQPLDVQPGEQIRVPPQFLSCGGAPSLHDLQLDQVDQTLFTPVSNPVKAFRFDFSQPGSLKKRDSSEVRVESQVEGTVDAIFMWWDLEMDPDGEIILTCAPRWAHPDSTNLPWRDHWMQAIFYPTHRLPVHPGQAFRIISQHDEYSLWFETAPMGQAASVMERPVCQCGLHIAFSRPRLAMLSDNVRNSTYLNVLRKHISSDSVCVCISDGSLLPLMAAKLGAKKVFAVEGNLLCARIIKSIIKENKLEDRIIVIEKPSSQVTAEDLQGFKVDMVMGEPHFQSHVLPWDNMHLWYAATSLRPLLTDRACVLPATMTICAMAMHFKDLWKIRAPVGLCEGFLLNAFDSMIKTSSDIVDENVEPQPLWEYPGDAMSEPVEVMSFHFNTSCADVPDQHHKLQLTCQREGTVNGVALWCEFHFGDGHTISTGPRQPPVIGQRVEWDYHSRQAVHLCHSPHAVSTHCTLHFHVHFKPNEGSISFTWDF